MRFNPRTLFPLAVFLVLGTFVVTRSCEGRLNRAKGSLHTEGPNIVDSEGQRVALRGVAIPDPEHADLKRAGQSASSLIDLAVNTFHAKVIRIPVLPGDDGITGWFVNPDAYFQDHLLPAVKHCAELGAYAIVDLHYISDYTTLKQPVTSFWRYVAPRLKDYPNVIFEIFNEPVEPSDWNTWLQTIAQPTVDLIRKLGADNLIIVGSPEWCTLVAKAATNPVVGPNIAYTVHIYPDQPSGSWDSTYGPILGKYPVFVTEWGYEQGGGDEVDGTTSAFGVPMKAWLDKHGLSWTAWIFDNEWAGRMFNSDWSLKGGDSGSGEFVKQFLGENLRALPPTTNGREK